MKAKHALLIIVSLLGVFVAWQLIALYNYSLTFKVKNIQINNANSGTITIGITVHTTSLFSLTLNSLLLSLTLNGQSIAPPNGYNVNLQNPTEFADNREIIIPIQFNPLQVLGSTLGNLGDYSNVVVGFGGSVSLKAAFIPINSIINTSDTVGNLTT